MFRVAQDQYSLSEMRENRTFMARPIIGIIGNHYVLDDRYPVHAGGTMNSSAVAGAAECMPVVVPSDPSYVTVEELLSHCDGFLLTG